MWKDPEPDPGGPSQKGTPSGQSSQELSDLKDQNEQQQLLIAQLKEMLRKEQSNVTHEKIEEYINTLSKVTAKKTRLKRDELGSTERSASSTSIDVNKKGKLNLLRQQLEENKARLAERGKNQKGIEDMVTQIQAQLNDSQQLINLAPLTSAEPKNLDYTRNSTPEELYNILLTKEKRITELVNKTQQQQVTILDLQDNVKEKDSVIDARTKAITLMTDSLSKKGKNTLDELDDTKEQMRKMQESFVTLESEMKARQVKLLNDLKAKNLEIAELQEINSKFLEEKSDTVENEHLKKISELQQKLRESMEEINKLKSDGAHKESSGEVAALKKQVEEGNRNMIKVKAQSKSKIKELTKKIEAFRKISDANALVVQLQNENTVLSEKIAELEEEKGNMQLKMVESTDSVKDSTLLEEHKELEDKLARKVEELDEKDKIISLLESDIISLKENVKSLNEKVSGLSHWENMEVTSEMKSIQIEEQMEKVERENAALRREIEDMSREKEELGEKIEELKKEKLELSTKLDNYIQENMELIDKLEKLSAEKVSSAESIEIVEGLTQQEKLELAAYQKNLDVPYEGEPLKCDDVDAMEPPVELNESVMRLSEDSTELLRKIDMFTMERKEVMDKLESLKEENARLSMKIKEIENNRDILAETYEQLQNEKEEVQHENDELVKKLKSFEEGGGQNAKSLGTSGVESDISKKLQDLQNGYDELLRENDELKRTIKDYDSKIQEKHNLESELSLARDKIEALETNIKSNVEELAFYQSLIEENKTELINSANFINELQIKLEDRENDVKDLNLIINDLNGVVNNLQEENSKISDFEVMETQVGQLKSALNDQIQQAQDYEEEIARNNDIIEELNAKLAEMNRKIIETEHDMEMKDIEAKKLTQDLLNKEETIKNLHSQIQEKDKKINVVVEDMKLKYLSLQKQLDGNSDSLDVKVQELTTKNKEQMERMKKIAANLKKKSQAYQELETKYNEDKEKWEREFTEKEDKIQQMLRQLQEAEEEIRQLQQSNDELRNSFTEPRHEEEKPNDVNLQQELSASLHEEFDETPSDHTFVGEEKSKELELIIETNRDALAHYAERARKLEEDVARLAEEKEKAEREVLELNNRLAVTSKNAEEQAQVEEELTRRLTQATANHEELTRKLDDAIVENNELSDKNKELEQLTYKLKVKLKKAHERVAQLKVTQAEAEELETANGELKRQLAALEASQRHARDENEELRTSSRMDYEKIEADYRTQMEELVGERNEVKVEGEKLQEALKEMRAREEELLSEVAEYKGKMEKQEDESRERIEQLLDEVRVANFNWSDALKEIASLNEIVDHLRAELITKVAAETVDDVINEARERVVDSATVGCQAVAEIRDANCQRDKDESSVGCQAVVELKHVDCQIDREENSVACQAVLEKEYSDLGVVNIAQESIETQAIPTFHWPATQQPAQAQDWFTSEQTFNAPQTSVPSDNTKEELLNKIRALEVLLYNVDKEKEEALRDCLGMIDELSRLLYEKVNAPKIESLSDIESQVMSQADVADAASKKKELHDMEFETSDVSLGEQSRPVVEEVVQPKRAYLTYQPEEKSIKPEAFGENDDGWGWGPEEAKLEEEHMSRAESDPRAHSSRSEIYRLNEELRVLQVERENHLEEIKRLQIKSGKLVKKCKELKLAATQQTQNEFLNLDETIQEELKSQIARLEKKIKELVGELEKEKLEKSNCLKRVDVLTAANEKMVEMKEIQDAEVLRWKRKHEEVEEKVRHYEWGSDGFGEGAKAEERVASTSSDNANIEELQRTVRELSADNDELQALLDEQCRLRINAEKAKVVPDVEELNRKIALLEQELSGKVKEIEAIISGKINIEEALSVEQRLVEQLRNELGVVMEKNLELERILVAKDESMKLEHDKGEKIEDMIGKVAELEEIVTQLRSTIDIQKGSLEEKSAALDEVSRLKEELSIQVAQLAADLDSQRQTYIQLQSDSSEIISKLQTELKDQQLRCEQLEAASIEKINEISAELEDVKRALAEAALKIAQLSEELEHERSKCVQLTSELEVATRGLRDEINATIGGGDFEAEQRQRQLQLEGSTEKVAELEREIEELKRSLEEKDKELEVRISSAAAELEESWMAQVDQRGADVAESWKLHLDTVEAEFASTREKLKYEIDELEEKCNALVNENNELRKNVDAEIRNEVDRVSALQQQINDRQQYITELNGKLINMQKENENMVGKLTRLEDEKERLSNDLADKETKLSSMNVIFDTTRQQFDEKREVVEEIVRILEKDTSRPLSFEKQELLTELQRRLDVVAEKEQHIMELTQLVNHLQARLNSIHNKDEEIANLQRQLAAIQEKDNEIFRLTKLVDELQQQLALVHEKDGEILTLNKLVEDLQKDLISVQGKDAEIVRLNGVIEELQRQVDSLRRYEEDISSLNQIIETYKAQHEFNQQEIVRLMEVQSNSNHAIEDYKQKLEEFKATHIVLQTSLEEKNQLIATLNQQLQFAVNLKNDNNKDVEQLQEEISQSKKDCAILQESLSECQQQLFTVTSNLANKTQEIENVNQQLAYSQRNFEIQEAESSKLRELMQAKEQEYTASMESMRDAQLRALENHYEEVLAAKQMDIESMRLQLQESIDNHEKFKENVEADASLREQLEVKVVEQSALLDEDNKQLIELRDIIEDQVMKIEELKKELFEKSGDYDSLIAEIDMGRKAITQQPTSSANVETTSQSERSQQQDEDLSEPVSRAELDLALYMLHQRDVRCEELTVELTQLLEERDTLQLRLSNAIREKEDIRRKLTGSEELPTSSTSSPSPATPLSKSSAIFLAASGTELATEPSESSSGMQELENKLSELKSVGYKKDKTFVDEQQLRRMQQMSIMQQHMNEASRLPAEAAAKLVDASYTVSRDVQSPSKVLLNWLWGRSTPRVNDT